MSARRLNIVLGVWLVLSGLLWPHGDTQFWNAVIVGSSITVFSILASEVLTQARFGNTLAGCWLLLSSFALPIQNEDTFWTHLVVGAMVLVISLRRSPRSAPWPGGLTLPPFLR